MPEITDRDVKRAIFDMVTDEAIDTGADSDDEGDGDTDVEAGEREQDG